MPARRNWGNRTDSGHLIRKTAVDMTPHGSTGQVVQSRLECVCRGTTLRERASRNSVGFDTNSQCAEDSTPVPHASGLVLQGRQEARVAE